MKYEIVVILILFIALNEASGSSENVEKELKFLQQNVGHQNSTKNNQENTLMGEWIDDGYQVSVSNDEAIYQHLADPTKKTFKKPLQVIGGKIHMISTNVISIVSSINKDLVNWNIYSNNKLVRTAVWSRPKTTTSDPIEQTTKNKQSIGKQETDLQQENKTHIISQEPREQDKKTEVLKTTTSDTNDQITEKIALPEIHIISQELREKNKKTESSNTTTYWHITIVLVFVMFISICTVWFVYDSGEYKPPHDEEETNDSYYIDINAEFAPNSSDSEPTVLSSAESVGTITITRAEEKSESFNSLFPNEKISQNNPTEKQTSFHSLFDE